MTEIFGSVYADSYDDLYQDKDYAAECSLIERLLETYSHGRVRSILDLGCGTGNHALPLAQRGYEVVGIDYSIDMLSKAKEKLAKIDDDVKTDYQQADIRTVDLQRQFDAALMMFTVLGYQLEDGDVLSALGSARRHLRQDGILIFDVWHGPAVLHQRPSDRVKKMSTPEGRVLREASGELDTRRHLCMVRYHVRRFKEGRFMAKTDESHSIRYFFPKELEQFLQSSDFALERLGGFPEFDQEPDETTWNVLGVAKAI